MLFNSIDFAFFLPIVFICYWFIFNKNLKLQNTFVFFASYLFYGWWEWKFLILIFFSTLVDYFVGRGFMAFDDSKRRKLLLWVSIIANLGLLGFFKYYNFFVDSFVTAFSFFGHPISGSSLNIILPIGISFYTFQTLSYSIDIYRKELEPTKDFIAFAAFVSFFPQLVAGPIERAINLLPQFYVKRHFDYQKAANGLRQILWGLFKKIVVADNCAEYANMIFNNSEVYTSSGSTLILGAIFFTFQVYGDFSGYSDIAIGSARLFGFNLRQNFAFPFFSRDMAEFWRRWHISLNTWFVNYLYIPLGGSKVGTWKKIRNVFVIFVISGFWHGASWNFIIWGALSALYFLPAILLEKNRKYTSEIVAHGRSLPTFKELISMITTVSLFGISLVIFRTTTVSQMIGYFSGILSSSVFTVPEFYGKKMAIVTSLFILLMIIVEWIYRDGKFALEGKFMTIRTSYRWTFYYFLMGCIIYFSGKELQFVYFQF